MSWGIANTFSTIQSGDCEATSNEVNREYCLAIKAADARITMLVASIGNNEGRNNGVTFPAIMIE